MKRVFLILASVVGLVILAFAGLVISNKLTDHHDRTHFDTVYKAQALTTPFVLQKQVWEQSGEFGHGHWTYTYTADMSLNDAIVQVQKQLSQNGYQTVANEPDTVNETSALLHRDQIVHAISLSAQVLNDSGASSTGNAGSPVEVIILVGALGSDL